MKHAAFSALTITCMLLLPGIITSGCQRPAGEIQIIMLPGDVPLEMVWIPPGRFIFGSPEDEQARKDWEGIQQEVSITRGFWMGKYPITQAQWWAIMGSNPSWYRGDNRPVERVSWNDIRDSGGYLEKLNDAFPEHNFRLPGESEWEYAYRAGTTSRFYWGDDPDYTAIDDYAWYNENSGGETHDVGLKLPNAWGLHDMAGNVWEWCEDDWRIYYNHTYNNGSAWVNSPRSNSRMLRGGAWSFDPSYCRAATLHSFAPGFRLSY